MFVTELLRQAGDAHSPLRRAYRYVSGGTVGGEKAPECTAGDDADVGVGDPSGGPGTIAAIVMSSLVFVVAVAAVGVWWGKRRPGAGEVGGGPGAGPQGRMAGSPSDAAATELPAREDWCELSHLDPQLDACTDHAHTAAAPPADDCLSNSGDLAAAPRPPDTAD
eukprot:TRINITY_DN2400_c1_g2_i2.p2 TRINITY_DN2400_c1_g2~~TRINITY_DN2400_c1_g2_i2.p2  ORF type:complete len:165 (+),score=3.55 TRINITY_DN2400_c1_g2_i2:585-1079(+)